MIQLIIEECKKQNDENFLLNEQEKELKTYKESAISNI